MDEWKYNTARDLDLPVKEALKSVKRDPGLPGVLAGLLKRPFLIAYLAGYHRLSITGREHLPTSFPFVLVSNHCSHLDAPLLSALVPFRLSSRLFPIAAGDTFFESYASSALAAFFMNALPIWRKKVSAHTLELFRARLIEEPCAYILFPEGTRSRDGNMARFKPGIGKIIAGQDVPVIPVHIDGAHRALPPSKSFPRPNKIRVHIGAPLRFTGHPNEKGGWLAVAAALQTAVETLAPHHQRSSN